MHLKRRLKRQWHVMRDPALKAQVNHLHMSVNYRLNEWRNEQWSNTLEFFDSGNQSLSKMTKWAMRVPAPSLLLIVAGRLVLPDS
jgi:hypothetical protein